MTESPPAKPTFHHELRNRAVIKRRKDQKEKQQARMSPPKPPRKPRVPSSDKAAHEMMARSLVKFINQSNSKLAAYSKQPKQFSEHNAPGQRQRKTPESNQRRNGSLESGKSGKSGKERSRNKREQKGSPMRDERTEDEDAMIVLLASWLNPSHSLSLPFPLPPQPFEAIPPCEPELVIQHRSTPLLPLISEVSIDENRSPFVQPVENPARTIPLMQEMVEQNLPVAISEKKLGRKPRKCRNKSADDKNPKKGHFTNSAQTNPAFFDWTKIRLRRNYYHVQGAMLAATEEEKEKVGKSQSLPVGFRLK